ncbi:MAG: 6-phosphogluconolactonase [Gemmatimonadota bacterium]
MDITIARDEHTFDVEAAWRIIAQILAKPTAVIGLSTGQTTINMHRIVAEIHRQYPFDVSGATFFNVDELTNLDRSYPGSCYARIQAELTGPLGVRPGNFVMPPTRSDDFDAECRRFEAELAARGGADLQMLGIGANGHVGINQPDTPFGRQTWVSPMDPDFEARVRRETGVGPDHELGGLTRGIKNIMHTRRLVLVAKGAHKAAIVARATCGPVTEAIPASALQLHPNCEVLLDAAAAAALTDEGRTLAETVRHV